MNKRQEEFERLINSVGNASLMAIIHGDVEQAYFDGHSLFVQRATSLGWEKTELDLSDASIVNFAMALARIAERQLNFNDGFENAPIGVFLASAKLYRQLFAGEGMVATFLIKRLEEGQRLPHIKREPWEPNL